MTYFEASNLEVAATGWLVTLLINNFKYYLDLNLNFGFGAFFLCWSSIKIKLFPTFHWIIKHDKGSPLILII